MSRRSMRKCQFFDLSLDGSEWSPSWTGRFFAKVSSASTRWRGSRLDALEQKRTTRTCARKRIVIPLSFCWLPSRYNNWVIPSSCLSMRGKFKCWSISVKCNFITFASPIHLFAFRLHLNREHRRASVNVTMKVRYHQNILEFSD